MTQRIGKFEILRKLGEGGMGEVLLARDPVIGREVALKTIRQGTAGLADARERFFREAQAAGRLNHPNLVTVHEFGEDAGLLYLAMEYVPGDDLTVLLQRRDLEAREVLEVLAQVCDGLAYAHQAGVLHRDIKPSNIRVARQGIKLHAKIMDFGIARVAGSDMTGTGTLLGTFGYMAPEYIQTGNPDPRVDLFAVGVILYEALAGERPFTGDTSGTVLYRILNEEPKPLDLDPVKGISPGILSVLHQALQKNPARRFQKAEAFAAALRAAMNPHWTGLEDPDRTRAASRVVPLPPPPIRRRPAYLLWGLPLVLMAAGGAFWWRGRSRAVPSPAPAPPTEFRGQGPGPKEPPPPHPHPEPPPQTAGGPTPPPEKRPGPPPGGPHGPSHPGLKSEPPAPRVANLDEAAALLDTRPKDVLGFLENHLVDDPSSERAQALRIVALYETGQYEACVKAMKTANKQGMPPRVLALKYPRLKQMFDQEREAKRLPVDEAFRQKQERLGRPPLMGPRRPPARG